MTVKPVGTIPMSPETLRVAAVLNGRIAGRAQLTDIDIVGASIARVRSASSLGALEPSVDVDGAAIIPGIVDPHVHLDKAYLLERLASSATLASALQAAAALRTTFTRTDMLERASRALGELVSNGVTSARVHVEVEPVLGLLGVDVHLQLRHRWAELIDLQLVAFPQNGLSSAPGTLELLEEAMRMGCGVVGGCPYADEEPDRHVADVLSLANRWGRPADFHVDFSDNPGDRTVDTIIAGTRSYGMAGEVTVGHVTALAAMPGYEARRRADGLAESGVTSWGYQPPTSFWADVRAQPSGPAPWRRSPCSPSGEST